MLKGISTHVTCVRSHMLFLLHSTDTGAHKQRSQYSCTVCNKSFCDKKNLKKHQRLHTGERPFFCGVCSKPYSDQRNLKKHLNMHIAKSIESQYRPHRCDVCKTRFVYKSNMTPRHKHVHGEGRQMECVSVTNHSPFCVILKDIN